LKDGHKSSDIDAPPSFPLITTPKEFKDASAEVCGKKWAQVNEEYPKDDQDKSNNNKWCFMLSYATSFLIDGLRLPSTKEITIQRSVEGSEVEWALGAVYKELEDFVSTNDDIKLVTSQSNNYGDIVRNDRREYWDKKNTISAHLRSDVH